MFVRLTACVCIRKIPQMFYIFWNLSFFPSIRLSLISSPLMNSNCYLSQKLIFTLSQSIPDTNNSINCMFSKVSCLYESFGVSCVSVRHVLEIFLFFFFFFSFLLFCYFSTYFFLTEYWVIVKRHFQNFIRFLFTWVVWTLIVSVNQLFQLCVFFRSLQSKSKFF